MPKPKTYQIIIVFLLFLIVIETFIILGKFKKVPPLRIPAKGKIALVLDDWGYNLDNLDLLNQIRYPLTMAVLPHLNYSKDVSKKLHQLHFQIILHLPMEPHEKYKLEKNTIMTFMDERKIISILKDSLATLLYVRGVSNHMGSKATEDLRIMRIIFKELKKKHLYFLDSFVTAKSVCPALAKQMHLAFLKRDIFLDNKEESVHIKNQFEKLKHKATLYGQAIGIGHARRGTLEVLKEVMPRLEKEGYKFVFISELVQ